MGEVTVSIVANFAGVQKLAGSAEAYMTFAGCMSKECFPKNAEWPQFTIS